MKGKFIVIEGIDGCGKTTQIDELSKWLPNSGLIKKGSKLITTREPGGSLLGKKLRGLILIIMKITNLHLLRNYCFTQRIELNTFPKLFHLL